MIKYEDITRKSRADIDRFLTNAFLIHKGISFRCGDTYYNVSKFSSEYLVTELVLDHSGHVKEMYDKDQYFCFKDLVDGIYMLATT